MTNKVPLRRSYPVEIPGHAKTALGKLAQHGDATQRKQMRDALSRRYPGIKSKQAPTG